MNRNGKSFTPKQALLGLVLDYVARKTKNSAIEEFCAEYACKGDKIEDIYQFYQNKQQNVRAENISNSLTHKSSINLDVSKRCKNSFSKKDKENDKSLSELCNICDGYGDLYHKLDLKRVDSDIGLIVKFILDTNIKVHYMNIKFSLITTRRSFTTVIKQIDKTYHRGRFTNEEDETMRKNWLELCQLCNIKQPEKLIEEIHKKKYLSSNQKRQKNVIGCYLGMNLNRVRHVSDIFNRSKISCRPNKAQRKSYSNEEDKIILDEVSKSGDTPTTWKTLSHKLERDEMYSDNIRSRYLYILNSMFKKKGSWSLEEDTVLLEAIFKNKLCHIDTVKSVDYASLISIKEVKRTKQSIIYRFRNILQPILLNYHLGTLNLSWKYNFFVHILNKKYKAMKEVNWEELVNLFPGQNTTSLSLTLKAAVTTVQRKNKNINFCDAIKMHIAKNIDDFNETQKEYRRKIVQIYLRCTAPRYE